MEQQEKGTMFNHAIKWGVINGAIGILIYVILYVVDYSLMVNWKFGIVGLLIGLTLISYATVDYRNSIGGYLSYGKAWQHGFVAFAISGIISMIFLALLYNVIDTELPAKLTETTLDNTREMMAGFGMPEDQIDGEVEKARERTENQFKIGGQALSYGISLIIFAILACVTAIFGKRNPPVDQM